MSLPEVFCERLRRIVPADQVEFVFASFSRPRKPTLRVNTFKITVAEAMVYLQDKGVAPEIAGVSPDAIILNGCDRSAMRDDPWITDGRLYMQNLSSMAAPVVLAPQPGERVLDLCAAPGSKTTQMAAMMRNEGSITAIEAIRGRFFKLKAVCELMGAKIVRPLCMDGRRYRSDGGLFDRILVDAPCSSEGLFDANDPETTRYWSERKIDEMSKKQRGLLLSASRLLKPGGTMVYSTCSFAPEENEGTVDWFLKKTGPGFGCVPIAFLSGSSPGLERWGKRVFHPDVRNAVRILPGEDRMGFFIAKFMLK